MGPGAQGKRSKQENEEAKALSTSENQLGEHVGFVIQSAYQDRTWNVCHLGRTKTPFAQVLDEATSDASGIVGAQLVPEQVFFCLESPGPLGMQVNDAVISAAVYSTLSCGVLRETFFEGASRCNVRVVYEAAALQQRSSSQHGQASGKDKPQGVHAQPGVPKVHFAKPLAKFATKGAKASSAKPAPVLKAAAPEPEQLDEKRKRGRPRKDATQQPSAQEQEQEPSKREADEAPAKRHKGRKAAAEVPGASAAAPSGKEGDVAHGAEGSDEEAAGLDALRTLACAAALQEEQDDTATKHKKASKKAQGQAVAKPKPAAAKPNDGGAKAGAMQQLNPEYLASGEVDVICGKLQGTLALPNDEAGVAASVTCHCVACTRKQAPAWSCAQWETHAGLGQYKRWKKSIKIINGVVDSDLVMPYLSWMELYEQTKLAASAQPGRAAGPSTAAVISPRTTRSQR